MIYDFHSHVLPGVDDGSACVEESIAMLQAEAQQGIRHVVATPHFYPHRDSPERFFERRNQAQELLLSQTEGTEGLPQLIMGAEVRFYPGISDWDILSELTIGKSRYILIEMTLPPWNQRAWQELEDIYYKRGLTPIIAHVDRYIRPLRTYGIPQRLEELPVLVQANASFFCEGLASGMAMKMLKRQQIHLLGSDCHNMTTRKPNLAEAVQKIRQRLGEEALSHINACARQVLSGE
jgi:protein-tyrosine phosphatase